MPPKVRISRPMILDAAYALVKVEGIECLNARSLAKKLHCSTQPIFSHFENMERLKVAVFEKSYQDYQAYFEALTIDENLFLNMGMTYIRFAKDEPQLFRLIFQNMYHRHADVKDYLSILRNTTIARSILKAIGRKRSAASDQAFTDMWLYTHGLATMLVSNQLEISKAETEKMLTRVYREILARL